VSQSVSANLASLVHSTKRLEREAKRAGILAEPPPPPLTDQEQAEHALAGADVQFGWRLTDLAADASGEGHERPLPPFEWDRAGLAQVTARIELRRELRLSSRECVVRKPPPEASRCLCLSEAIDAAIASGQPTTRDEVLKAARRAHGERWAWLKRKPKPRPEPPSPDRHEFRDRSRKTPKPVPAAFVTERPSDSRKCRGQTR
jgi:hypothetical protein